MRLFAPPLATERSLFGLACVAAVASLALVARSAGPQVRPLAQDPVLREDDRLSIAGVEVSEDGPLWVLARVPGATCQDPLPALDGLRCGAGSEEAPGWTSVTLDGLRPGDGLPYVQGDRLASLVEQLPTGRLWVEFTLNELQPPLVRRQTFDAESPRGSELVFLNAQLERIRSAADRLVVAGEGVGWGLSRQPDVAEDAPALPPSEATVGDQQDVVLIVLDTLRADRVDRMPHLQAWAEGARRYPHMRSVSSWTLPAHASLFTGRHPREHGAHGSDNAVGAQGLDTRLPTLAERLADEGYSTVGIAANVAFLDSRWGLARGFQQWHCEALGGGRPRLPYHQADRVVDLALQALEHDGPQFLFVNLMEPHTPWTAREGFTVGPIDPSTLPRERGRYAELRRDLLVDRVADPTALESWGNAYDAEARYLDAQLSRLLEALDEDALVVVLADHGEFLGEHALVEHSKGLYDEALRVPLFIRGLPAGEDPLSIQTDDVPDLILEHLGLQPLGTEESLQIAELHGARAKDRRSPRVMERTDRRLLAYAEGDHLVIQDQHSGEVEAFEGGVPATGPWVDRLLNEGANWIQQTPSWQGEWQVPADLDGLKALGYLDEDAH
jgi:hypothetical protein